MMNKRVVQSSPVQHMVATGGPKWWCINNMRPSSQHQHQSFLAAPPQNHLPYQSITSPLFASGTSSWTDCQEPLPESRSQLVSGRVVGEQDYKGTWEKHDRLILNQISTSNSTKYGATQDPVIKQDNANVEFQLAAKSTNCRSPSSCVTTLSSNILDFPHKSSDQCNSSNGTGGAAKKARFQTSSSAQSAIKVRKEKLGDRITALHQIVSPFGKTDTASVLLEAIGYIRFLQSQIEALSLPYLDSTAPGNIRQHKPERCNEGPKKDLKSRGLCLVPISCCTFEVGSQNGAADYWAPAFGPNFQ